MLLGAVLKDELSSEEEETVGVGAAEEVDNEAVVVSAACERCSCASDTLVEELGEEYGTSATGCKTY